MQGGAALGQAACGALSGLTTSADNRAMVFGALLAYLNSTEAPAACRAISAVAGGVCAWALGTGIVVLICV